MAHFQSCSKVSSLILSILSIQTCIESKVNQPHSWTSVLKRSQQVDECHGINTLGETSPAHGREGHMDHHLLSFFGLLFHRKVLSLPDQYLKLDRDPLPWPEHTSRQRLIPQWFGFFFSFFFFLPGWVPALLEARPSYTSQKVPVAKSKSAPLETSLE